MEDREYTRMFEAEQRSWWFCGRRRVLDQVISRLDLGENPRILDIGCGTGGNLAMLGRHGAATGVEFSETAARFARERTGSDVLWGPAEAVPIEEGDFSLVTMLDVLEHLDDEAPALAEVCRLLTPGGRLLVTVPAFMLLWSGHDVALHHRRRYRRPQLRNALEAAGLRVRWISYYNAALFPPVAAVRMARRLVGGGAAKADVAGGVPGPFNAALEGLFAFERHLIGRVSLPFGVSLIALCEAS